MCSHRPTLYFGSSFIPFLPPPPPHICRQGGYTLSFRRHTCKSIWSARANRFKPDTHTHRHTHTHRICTHGVSFSRHTRVDLTNTARSIASQQQSSRFICISAVERIKRAPNQLVHQHKQFIKTLNLIAWIICMLNSTKKLTTPMTTIKC